MIDKKLFLISQLKVLWEQIIAFEKLHRDDYTTSCLLDYPYFKDYYKMIIIISFTGNLKQRGSARMLIIIEEA